MNNAYIVAAKRTPIGKFGGVFKDMSPISLGASAMQAVLMQAGVDGDKLDLYMMGNVLRAGHGQLLPRQAAFKAGIPNTIDGYAVDMVCSSAMMAVINAATFIKAGEADLVLAGGMESMSQTGFYLSHRARWGYRYLAGRPEGVIDILEYDGLTDPITDEAMGDETDRLSEAYEVTRSEVDTVAFHSHERATVATEEHLFAQEIAPVEVKTRKGSTLVQRDEGIRSDTTLESLGKLRPAFTANGILTAGNSSQLSDGAAAVLLASESALEQRNLTPLAKIVSSAWAAGETWRFAEAPIPAVQKLLAKQSMKVADIDLYENNEAFATNSVLFHKVLGIPYEKLNVHGGAIALGHPIGCTGTRIIVTLINALKQRDGQFGVAALCHGTGGGTAVLVENS